MTDGETDSYESWRLAIECLRVQHEAGRKLTPKEMLAMIDKTPVDSYTIEPDKLAAMIERRLVCDGLIKSSDRWSLTITNSRVIITVLERVKT